MHNIVPIKIIIDNLLEIINANFDQTTMAILQLTNKQLCNAVKKVVKYKMYDGCVLDAQICKLCKNHEFGKLLSDIIATNTYINKISLANTLVKYGNCKDLRWLLQTYSTEFVDWKPLLKGAAKNSVEMLEYAFGINPNLSGTNSECNAAAGAGKLECLKFINNTYNNVNCWDESTCAKAAEFGSVECLDYLRVHGCPWDESTCETASENGNIECLRYAHKHKCPWNEITCESAVGGDGKMLRKNEYNLFKKHDIIKKRFECLKYAHENGCPWSKNVCNVAAYYGKLRCLKYLHTNGCPWDEYKTCECAAGTGNYRCLKYAYEHGCPFNYHAICVAHVYGESSECVNYMLKHYDEATKCSKPFFEEQKIDSIQSDDDENNSIDIDSDNNSDDNSIDDDDCDIDMLDCYDYSNAVATHILDDNKQFGKRTMSYITKYTQYHCSTTKTTKKILLNNHMEIIINEWDNNFIHDILNECKSTKYDLLLSIIDASNILNIKHLHKLMCATFMSVIIGKMPNQIREMFGIVNDYNPEEYINDIKKINWIAN